MLKKFALALGILVILVIAYNLIGQIFSTLKSGERVEEASQKLHLLELENAELKKRLQEVKNDDFIEQQARDKLGLAKEGETIVIIPDEKIDLILGQAKEQKKPRLPNWQGWLKVFLH